MAARDGARDAVEPHTADAQLNEWILAWIAHQLPRSPMDLCQGNIFYAARDLMNGYSGYTPASYTEYANTFWCFPRAHAIDAMRRAGVTHVRVHLARFGHEADGVVAELGTRPEFELLAVGSRGAEAVCCAESIGNSLRKPKASCNLTRSVEV